MSKTHFRKHRGEVAFINCVARIVQSHLSGMKNGRELHHVTYILS
jgi:hypothetical protein